jgi:uncharacterized protein with von Willebrand factor type A (vWA) domain
MDLIQTSEPRSLTGAQITELRLEQRRSQPPAISQTNGKYYLMPPEELVDKLSILFRMFYRPLRLLSSSWAYYI